MNVLLIAPGFPAEMPFFTRGLADVGARVIGVAEGSAAGLPEMARAHLADYVRVRSLFDEDATVQQVQRALRGRGVDRVECLWEPGVVLAAKLRRALGVPGMTVEEALPFRDKESMKQVLDAAGIRTPHHFRARTGQEVREAAERIGYPLIVKPIAGAGSADTYPVRSEEDLQEALTLIKHVPEVSVEEYVEGEELTFDTVCSEGEILFHNVAWYRPKPLVARLNPWINSVSIALRDTEVAEIRKGRSMGEAVLRALGFRTGFTHMEWFLTPKGEAIFGEIGARAPGARLVHAMNYTCDADLFRGWAEAVCFGHLRQDMTKTYNAGLVFKRAQGEGIIRSYEGLEPILTQWGEFIPAIELTPVGQPRKDWRNSAVGDGWMVVRHPDLQTTIEVGDRLASEFRMVAH